MKRGFTLIEFMVIASLLAIAGTIAVHLVALQRVQPTRHALEATRQALEQYKSQFGAYPDTLEPLVEKKLLPELLKDQWGQPLVFRMSAGTPQLYSAGPDGHPDNQDDVLDK